MYKILLALLLSIIIFSCNILPTQKHLKVQSPSKNIAVTFQLLSDGTPTYIVNFNEERIIDTSKFGFDFKGITSIKNNFQIVKLNQQTLRLLNL